ncbi:hypothetical protein QYM36_008149 [Artemia franciscana]|uniref:Myb/SANT-like DNA-binding domain-containing protein n=1 Tax=Artemia franciscana TaxID=6661 RepID=A0AA88IHR6_ARTSF|nr:hypothetical protein QYM36_008149 [Artemia franciscana]
MEQGFNGIEAPIAILAKTTNTRDKTGLLEETRSNASYEDTPAMNKEWDKRSTLILIQLCKDEEGTSNYSRKFWETTSTTLENSLYKFSWEQCKIKFQNLKAQYKQKKEKTQQSGEGRITWQFYDEMDNLMAKKPEISPVATASNEDGFKIDEENCEHSESESDYTSEPEVSQKRKTKKKKTVVEILHKLTEQAERRHKERYEQRERALKLLQEIRDKNVQ